MQPELKQVSVIGRRWLSQARLCRVGAAEAEHTVVCVHGVSRTGRDFDMLAAALAAKGVRVIVPDLPGRGRSDWLASPAHYTDRAYVRAMSTLVARLERRSG